MHDKLQPTARPVFALPDHRVIELAGRDAIGFAQAQFMNDVAALEAGRWHWNGWLTPKGRVIALFALIRFSADQAWILLLDADPESMASTLKRYVFRSRVEIRVREDLHVAGCFEAPHAAASGAIAGDAATGYEFDLGAEGGPRTVVVGPRPAAANGPDNDRWRIADIEHGLPRLPASQLDRWTPQQLSLDRLAAFSIRKGCYPGQEIVARTHFLGKAKRGLALLESAAAMRVGSDLCGPESPLGNVVASASDGARHLALAVAPIVRDADSLSVDGIGVHETPLKGGLAR